MIQTATVDEFMATTLIVTQPEASIYDAVELLLQHRVSGLPVVDAEGRLVGMMTEQDCLREVFRSRYHQQPGRRIGEVMSRDLTTLEAGTDVMIAVDLFLNRPFRRLPVLKEGRLVGLLSRRDALKYVKASA